jgi:hypothetical protein
LEWAVLTKRKNEGVKMRTNIQRRRKNLRKNLRKNRVTMAIMEKKIMGVIAAAMEKRHKKIRMRV